jgi:hypothetical protein
VNDTPGSRVIESGDTFISSEEGVVFDGLDYLQVEARSTDVGASEIAMEIVGGAVSQSGSYSFGRYSLFGGDSNTAALDGVEFDVRTGGQLTLQEDWHDGSPPSLLYAHLTDSGDVAIQGTAIETPSATPILIDGFRGDVSLMDFALVNGGVSVSGDQSQLRLLILGGLKLNCSVDPPLLSVSTLGSEIGVVMDYQVGAAWVPVPDEGNGSPEFIEGMLSHIRNVHTTPMLPVTSGLTDLLLDGVMITNGGVKSMALHLVPASSHPEVEQYEIQDLQTQQALSQDSGGAVVLDSAATSSQNRWKFQRLNDGSTLLMDASSGQVLDADLQARAQSGSPSQSWSVEFIGDGTYSICNPWSGLCLSVGEDGQIITAPRWDTKRGWSILPN